MTSFKTSDGLEIGIGEEGLPGLRLQPFPGDMEPVVRAAAEPGSQRMTANAFVGLLLPYHIHNINNMLVGVLGNAELACMFLPGDVNRALPKVRDAAEAAGAVTRFLRDLSECTHPSLDRASTQSAPLARLGRFITLACGRSVDSGGLRELETLPLPGNREPGSAFGALLGAGVWSVLRLGGTGSLTCQGRDGSVLLQWARPPGAGEPMLPGSEMASTVICAAGGLAGRAGCILRVSSDSPLAGSAELESVGNAG